MSDVHSGSVGRTESLANTVGDVSNVLVLSPSEEDERRRERGQGCGDLLAGPGHDVDRLLGVVYRDPERWFDRLRSTVGRVPAETTILTVDGPDRSPTKTPIGDGSASAPTVETVDGDHPEALPAAVRERVEEADADADADADVALCFDSVSTLVSELGLTRSFRFFDTLTGQLAQAGGTGHFHLDPTAHDEQTLSALTTTFDAVVRSGGDGEWELVWKRLPD